MRVVSRYTAADATGTVEPCGHTIAPSMVFVAGVLLSSMVLVIGIIGILSLLTTLVAALGTGWGSAHGHSWPYRSSLTAARRAFLPSVAGWLLALVVWYSGQDWPAVLPGVVYGGAGVVVVWRTAAGRSAQCRPRVGGATLLSVVVVIAATLLTQHTVGVGRSGICFAFVTLLGLLLLGALIVHIRQPESAAQVSPRGK